MAKTIKQDNNDHDKVFTAMMRSLMVPVHKAGIPFIAAFVLLAVLSVMFAPIYGVVLIIFTLFVVYFFRNPKRVVPNREWVFVAPADGIVSDVRRGLPLPSELREDARNPNGYTRISIFLSVFDVHIQRVPIGGVVKSVRYHPGKFLNAASDKASDENERSTTFIETGKGMQIAVVQIAGLIARRIVNNLNEGQQVQRGEELGIIRFGSRVDLYFPDGITPLVLVGQRMIGGETVVAQYGGNN